MSAGLDIRDVVVRYGSKTAVDGVSTSVAPGQIVALLGPSGSGKSSLLRAIAGLEPVAAGDILWDGRSVTNEPVHRRGFGLMFQDGQLFPHRSVAGNVAFGLRHLSRHDRQRRVDEALSLVGMSDYAGRSVLSLSGGQAQRVALARSLAPRPSLLLLDEPLSALDRSLRERLSTEIRQILRSSGSTCVYVTHDQDEAFAVADVIGVMIDGRIAAWSSPQELWANPGSRAVAEFLGFGPFFPAHNVTLSPSSSAEGDPLLYALPPGALKLQDLPSTSLHSETHILELAGTVEEVRGARGRIVLDVNVDGHTVRAWSEPTVASLDLLRGSQVTLCADLSRCPLVSP